MEAVSTILVVVQQIAKAAETARQNKAKCRDLAERAQILGDTLRESSATATAEGDGAAASSKGALGRLNAALDDALKLVESCCHRRRAGTGWLFSLLTSARTAESFQDVDKRITACVGDLGLEQTLQLNSAAAAANRLSEKEANRGRKKQNGGDKQNNKGTNDRSNKGKGKNNKKKNVTAIATAKPSSKARTEEQPSSVQGQERPKRESKPNPKYFGINWTT